MSRGLGFGIGLGLTPYGWGRGWHPASLFANNEPGFVLPVDPQFLFQDAAGTIPVTAPGDPVGLRLDVSRMGGKSLAAFLAGQAELYTEQDAQVSNSVGGAVVSFDQSSKTITVSSAGSEFGYPRIQWTNLGLVAGRRYRVAGRTVNTGSVVLQQGRLAASGSDNDFSVSPAGGPFFGTLVAGTGPRLAFIVNGTSGTGTIQIAELSIKEIPGNHFIQTTDAARPTYQIDGNGKPCLVYDGSDDFMVSAANVDFSGTDEMLVCAGIHKASDAAAGMFVEHSSSSNSNNGVFYLLCSSGGGPSIQHSSKGTIGVSATYGSVEAPITLVVAGYSKIGMNFNRLRADGVQRAQNTNSQGTGNYGNHPVYLGRRGGTTLPFNGRDYGLTVLGRLPTDAELARVEAYYAKASGVTL